MPETIPDWAAGADTVDTPDWATEASAPPDWAAGETLTPESLADYQKGQPKFYQPSGLETTTDLTAKIGEDLDKPLVQIFPELTPEEQKALTEASPEEQRQAGYAQGTAQFINGLTSPRNLLLLAGTGGLGLPVTASRAVALGFAVDMGRQVPDLARQLGEEYAKPEGQRDQQKIGQLISTGAGIVGFTSLAGTHAAGNVTEAYKLGLDNALRLTSDPFVKRTGRGGDLTAVAPLAVEARPIARPTEPEPPEWALDYGQGGEMPRTPAVGGEVPEGRAVTPLTAESGAQGTARPTIPEPLPSELDYGVGGEMPRESSKFQGPESFKPETPNTKNQTPEQTPNTKNQTPKAQRRESVQSRLERALVAADTALAESKLPPHVRYADTVANTWGTLKPGGKRLTPAAMELRIVELEAARDFFIKNAVKPVETPTAAVAKVQEHVAAVAEGKKKVVEQTPGQTPNTKTQTPKAVTGPRPAKEIKSELVQRLEAALEKAPDARITKPEDINKLTVKIPGDGTFKIVNTKQAVEQVLSEAKKINTSSNAIRKMPTGGVGDLAKQAADAAQAYGSPEAAYRSAKRQREALPDNDPSTPNIAAAADMLLERIFELTNAGKLDAKAWNLAAQLKSVRKDLEMVQGELAKAKRKPQENARNKESVKYWNEREIKELQRVQKLSIEEQSAREAADQARAELGAVAEPKVRESRTVEDIWNDQYQRQLAQLNEIVSKGGAGGAQAVEIKATAKMLNLPAERVAKDLADVGMLPHNVEYAMRNYGAESRGTSGVGFPAAAAPVPPTPPPAPAPGVTMIQHGRLPVTLDRTAPGSVSVPQIMDAMQRVVQSAGSQAGNLRTGRFLQNALGIWKPHEEIIRMQSADAIPTATHEVGHGLQQLIYGTFKARGLRFLSPAIRRELIGMGRALYGTRKPVAGYTGEGFAEFARYWLTTNDAARVAPQMTRFFETQFLPAHPKVAKALGDARALVDIWRHQGSAERAQRQLVREPGAMRKLVDALARFVGYQSQFETGAPIEAISKAAARKLGRPLSPSEDPFKLYSWKRGSAGATVERMATEHMLDVWGNPVGPSLAEALAPVKGNRKEFLLYIFAQAAEMRWRQGKNPGISLEDARHIKALYDSPAFAIAADKYRKWNDQLLDYLVQADPSMADAVAAMRGANDFYAPLARMIDPAKAKALAAQTQSNSLMRMYGSGLPVKDIFDQTFINAARLVNRANRALVTRSIIKLARLPGLGHMVEEVPRDRVRERVNVEQIRKQMEDMGVDTTKIPQDTLLEYFSLADRPKGADPIVSVKDATGATRWFQVDPRLYDTLEGLQTFSLKQSFPGIPYLGTMLDLVLGTPARAFRLGTTGLRPAFSLVTNPTRDLATLLAQTSSNPAKVAAMYPAAMAEAIRGGPYKSAFYDLGAHLGQPLGTDIGHTQRVSKELFHGRIMRVVRNPVDHLRELLSITESAPRIAELRAVADDIGWKPGKPLSPDQAVQLALAAKRVTVDFSAAGDVSRVLNQAIPFYNPALQGMRSFARAFKNNPAKASLMGLAMFTGPALALWWQNKDKEWYQALPWRERYLYTHIDDGKNVWRIPRPFEWGNAFMVIPEAALDSFYRHDPAAAKAALGAIFDSTNPVDLPVLAKLAKEQWQNRVDFWDRPIIPRGEQDLPAAEQVGPYTSRLAIGINKAFPDVSPRRVDAAVRGYFGGLGTAVMDLMGIGAERQDRQWEASDFPVFGTFFRRGGEFNAQNQHINDFWDTYLPSRARVAGFNHAKSQVEKGLRSPDTIKPPGIGDIGTASIGADASPAIQLLLTLAARTKETRARSELYRQAGEIARDATVAMRNAQKSDKPQ